MFPNSNPVILLPGSHAQPESSPPSGTATNGHPTETGGFDGGGGGGGGESSGLIPGAAAGIGIGSTLVAVLLVSGMVFFVRRHRNARNENMLQEQGGWTRDANNEPNPPYELSNTVINTPNTMCQREPGEVDGMGDQGYHNPR